MTAYLDTSALVKYYSDESLEPGCAYINQLLDRAKKGQEKLVSSILLVGETISVFDKWARRGWISEEERYSLVALFFQDIQLLVQKEALILEPISPEQSVLSITSILTHHLTLHDAIHLHTALSFPEKIILFVCSDKNLCDAAKKEGFVIIDPEEETVH